MRIRFSATSLQDYVDCPRRFQLRYLLELPWPALETDAPDELEQRAQRGRDLHRLIHQHLAGLSVAPPPTAPPDSPLPAWWRSFQAFAAGWPTWRVVPEVLVSVPLAGQRVAVRYDALAWAMRPDEAGPACVILEWKTHRRPPPRAWLSARVQSRLYPLALLLTGWPSPTCGQPVTAADLEMWYWLAGPPAHVERFAYSPAQQQADRAYLEALITQIAQRAAGSVTAGGDADRWELTGRQQLCAMCVYRSLCERDAAALMPDLPEADDQADDFPDAADATDSGWSQVQESVF
jgi:hypothetical protein